MDKIIKVIKRYRFFIILLVINTVIIVVKPDIGLKSLQLTKSNALEMLSILPPVFILLGLLNNRVAEFQSSENFEFLWKAGMKWKV
jgi:hypothetical protein